MARIPLLGAKYQPRMAEDDMNFFFVAEQRGAGIMEAVYGTPGLLTWKDPGYVGQGRCGKIIQGILYFVVGNRFYSCTTAAVCTQHGTIGTTTGPCYIEDNGTQIMLVDGAAGYIYTIATSVFAQITDADYLWFGSLAYLDGYFIGHDPDSGQFGISASYDGTTWDALDFASAEGRPDNILQSLTAHRELWLFGTNTTEVFYNSGASSFPIERLSGGFIEHGILAAESAVLIDNTPLWLASDPKTGERLFVRASGYTPQIVCDDFMSYQLDHMTTVSDAKAYGYSEGGHTFYVCNFPTENKTFVYDLKTGQWHRRASFPVNGRHRGNWYVNFAGKHLVGDFENGIIYEMSLDIYDEDGTEIQRAWTLSEVRSTEWVFHSELVVELETGLVAASETDPQLMLDYTENGGKTWSSERQISVGTVGRYTGEVRARRLGRARCRAYRIKVSASRKWGILGVDLRAGTGTH
jgi:hypothetical protein